jgi:ubiquitin carboxyl-terminal hydrolase L5
MSEMATNALRQTASNACASVALLNIVNNIEEIELGEHLQHFKDFTMKFTPALRGDAISNFDFVKQVHNSFARYVWPGYNNP